MAAKSKKTQEKGISCLVPLRDSEASGMGVSLDGKLKGVRGNLSKKASSRAVRRRGEGK